MSSLVIERRENVKKTNSNPVLADSSVHLFFPRLRKENRYYGEKGGFDMVSRVGEGWTFGLEPGEIKPFLAKRGFAVAAHYTPTELEKNYLTGQDGSLYGRVNGTHCIVLASVNGAINEKRNA